MAFAAPGIVDLRSASSNTTLGDLPPSSSETFFRFPAAACKISLPTSVDPVNATLSTSGCDDSAAPAVSPYPGNDVDYAFRNSGFGNQFGQQQRAQRRLLCRLQNDGTACGQRRAQLPCRHQQRKVPGDDLPHHADGLAARVGEEFGFASAGGDGNGVAFNLGGPARHVAEQVDGQRHIGDARDRQRLAVVQRLSSCANSSRCCSIRSASFQMRRPRSDGVMLRPGTVFEGLACGFHGAIDIFAIALGDLGQHFARGRVVGRESLAGSGLNPLAVNEHLARGSNEILHAAVNLGSSCGG